MGLVAKGGVNQPRLNVKVSDKETRFFESSSSPQDGFVEHKYTYNDQEMVTYRKYYSAVNGKITSISIDDYGNTNVKLASMQENEHTGQLEKVNIGLSIKNYGKGALSRSSQALLNVLYMTDLSRPVQFNFYKKTKAIEDDKGNERDVTNIYCGLNYYDLEKDQVLEERPELMDFTKIPRPTDKPDPFDKKKKIWDFTKVNQFYADIFNKVQEKIPENNWEFDLPETIKIEEEELFPTEEKKSPIDNFTDEAVNAAEKNTKKTKTKAKKEIAEDTPFD